MEYAYQLISFCLFLEVQQLLIYVHMESFFIRALSISFFFFFSFCYIFLFGSINDSTQAMPTPSRWNGYFVPHSVGAMQYQCLHMLILIALILTVRLELSCT